MKKKGFTLIELLAVIVVLAIIALIATPIVMNVIKNAEMGAAERSADNYVKAVETLIATEKLDGNTIADGSYTITSTGKLTIDGKEHEVEVSGTKPVGGTIKIENGQVVKNESSIKVGDYTVTFEDGKATIKELVKLLDVCNFLENDTHNEGRNPNTVGAKYSCDLGPGARNFYVLTPGDNSKAATLILEGNYDMETLAWCDQEGENPRDNVCAADGLALKLDDIVENAWTKLDRSQIGIPSMEQIMVADGQEEDAYLDLPKLNNEWLYSWDNEAWRDTVLGYWTSTPYADSSYYAWLVNDLGYVDSDSADYDGYVNDDNVDIDEGYGVRPVITLSI